jgi:hypothetical protein
MIIELITTNIPTIIVDIISATIISILSYIFYSILKYNKKLDQIIEKQNKFDRILFGEEGVDEWSGVICMIGEVRENTKENRYILRILTNKLISQKHLDMNDKDIECIFDMLNTFHDV